MTTQSAVETKHVPITNVQYFQAKLAYEITPWSLKAALDKAPEKLHLVDVRSPESFAAAHLPTAVNIPLADIVSNLGTLPKNKTIVVYCGNMTCSLAPKAALELAQKGFTVQQLTGGLATWQEQGFPVQKKA